MMARLVVWHGGRLIAVLWGGIVAVQIIAPSFPSIGMVAYHTSGGITDGNIYLMDVGRLLIVPLTHVYAQNEYGASWSSDGTHILFHADQPDDVFNLFVLNLVTDVIQPVPTDREGSIFGDWSPDGDEIVFQSGSRGYITHLITGETTRLPIDSNARNFAWSPDGERLAFVSGDAAQIYILYLATNKIEQLTYEERADFPEWSPDGTRLIYQRSAQGGGINLYVVDVTTRKSTPLVTSPDYEMHADWSPDGRYIVFNRVASSGGKYNLYLFDTHTGKERPLPSSDLNDYSPAWMP